MRPQLALLGLEWVNFQVLRRTNASLSRKNSIDDKVAADQRTDQIFDHLDWGIDICKRVNSPRVKILFDCYHVQIMDGDLTRRLQENLDHICHIHVAGVPSRQEIDDTQEVNYRFVANRIAELGYTGYVAHEFRPGTGRDAVKSLEQIEQTEASFGICAERTVQHWEYHGGLARRWCDGERWFDDGTRGRELGWERVRTACERSERIGGLARVLRSYVVAALENCALWHERDISHSSVERIIFPDSCTLLDYMFGLLTRLMDGIVVYPANMKKNLGLSLGMWNSQTVLLALIRKGLTREAAYKLCQDAAMKTWEVKHAGRDDANFLEVLKADPAVAKHFRKGELEALCSLDFHFKEVNNRFKKLGL